MMIPPTELYCHPRRHRYFYHNRKWYVLGSERANAQLSLEDQQIQSAAYYRTPRTTSSLEAAVILGYMIINAAPKYNCWLENPSPDTEVGLAQAVQSVADHLACFRHLPFGLLVHALAVLDVPRVEAQEIVALDRGIVFARSHGQIDATPRSLLMCSISRALNRYLEVD